MGLSLKLHPLQRIRFHCSSGLVIEGVAYIHDSDVFCWRARVYQVPRHVQSHLETKRRRGDRLSRVSFHREEAREGETVRIRATASKCRSVERLGQPFVQEREKGREEGSKRRQEQELRRRIGPNVVGSKQRNSKEPADVAQEQGGCSS